MATRRKLSRGEKAARAVERMGRVMQVRAGIAPPPAPVDRAGYVDEKTQGEVKLYMRRVNDSYDELNKPIVDWMAAAKSTDAKAWKFANEWMVLYSQWKKFYEETIDDWMITTDDDQQSQYFGSRLEKARTEYKSALGSAPPGGAVVPTPSTHEDPPGPENPLQQVTSLLKWGAIAYVVINVGQMVIKRG